MSGSGNWCLIESDPGVFTELIRGFGVESLECEEVYDLTSTSNVSDALGFIFLFNYDDKQDDAGEVVFDENSRGIFFAKQTISNACATQAIINILLNIDDKVPIGSTLSNFKSFVSDFDSTMKGTAISNSDQIRVVHNSFSNYQLFEFDERAPKSNEDVYHFVSYLPINGTLYELDGLKPGPIDHGKLPENSSWINSVRPLLMKRMEKCVDGKFNIMAVVPNRLAMYENQLAQFKMDSGEPSTAYIAELKSNIANEKKKIAAYRAENIRRRHNYLPLIVELLKVLGESGQLVSLVEKAQKIALERSALNAPNAAKKVKFA
ncbi:Ubiquitin carboxyl-terminal hydrolase isozyme L5 [Schistosoma japonicum]|uniref:Ubiquitin carboxyl-terminal hydrolase n=1 Tax=Schistosoma japonicum TaxID=6182 RepID=A0A4Z2D011_SCHJA|nr:Ubiquitin carboxyl-terminal hydrolase isozyme L5 [Schistosoma japonicum]TNN09827.1 Ubiquitin carboxyl-terminal hydrolase isozyme L5 [Schistosoma japonicum]